MLGGFLPARGLAEQLSVDRDDGIAADHPVIRTIPADRDCLGFGKALGDRLEIRLALLLGLLVDVRPDDLELDARILEHLAANGASGSENDSGHEQPCGKEGAAS